jgi:hypothetical protein
MVYINRPDDGFHIRWTSEALAQREEICLESLDHCRRLTGLVNLATMVGHIQGIPLNEEDPMSLKVMSDVEKTHVVSLTYGLLGDSMTIYGARCFDFGEP